MRPLAVRTFVVLAVVALASCGDSPTDPEDGWHVVLEVSGTGDKQTQGFDISSREWRVRWESEPLEDDWDGLLHVFVERADGSGWVDQYYIEPGTTVSYVHADPGRFYLDISAISVAWAAWVEVPP